MLSNDDHNLQLLFAKEFATKLSPSGEPDVATLYPYLRDISAAYLDLAERRGLPQEKLICYPSIQLISGEYFDFIDPVNSPMYPGDIAHALAKLSRYNGHTIGPAIYTIGQHCVMGAEVAPPGYKLAFLLHDAPEFVLGDMTTPLKQLCPDFKAVEKRVEAAMFKRFGVPFPMHPKIKEIDLRMAVTEKRDLMPAELDDAEGWPSFRGYQPFDFKITPWSYGETRVRWLDAYERYINEASFSDKP